MAKGYTVGLLKILLYYLLLFALCRLLFLIYFSSEVLTQGVAVFFLSLWKALPLDISAASYLLFVPLILLLVETFYKHKLTRFFLKSYLLLTSIAIVALSVSEIAVYREMHVKLYFNLLSHLAHPLELFRSVSTGLLLIILFLFWAVVWLCYLGLNKLFPAHIAVEKTSRTEWIKVFFVFAIATGLLVIGCRGGLQPIPINEGEVYFSHSQCVNDATVNPLWNIIHSYVENRHVLANGYKIMPDDEADRIVDDLFITQKDTTISILKIKRPNVCILILESWSADVVASLGGYEGLTPNFEKLAKDGYLFTNIKPAGHVSDQGIPAILSGYPALPIGSAINQPERQVNLPCLNNELNGAGYYSSFFFGGQLIYGNIKSYIYRNEFSSVIEQENLPANIPAGKLGIHDSLMLSIWHDSIQQMRSPFFSCLFTASTHSPFDMPVANSVDWGKGYTPYLNSVVYADRQLGFFFEEVKNETWYDSTVFIIVADHSHGTPKDYPYCSPELYHIPLLIYGGALKDEYRGKQYTAIASQTDIAATLLNQLQLNASNYRWSKNLMNPAVRPFAFYTFDEGFGYVEPGKQIVWNKKFPQMSTNSETGTGKDSLYTKGAAFLQVLMKDFLSK